MENKVKLQENLEALSLKELQSLFEAEANRTLSVAPNSSIQPNQEVALDTIPLETIQRLVKIQDAIETKVETENKLAQTEDPLLEIDRLAANQKIEELTSKIRSIKSDIFNKTDQLAPSNYFEVIKKYLGENYVTPHIKDVAFPDLSKFNIRETPALINNISEQMFANNLTKLKIITESVTNGSSENDVSSGFHIFSKLIPTSTGYKFEIDEQRTGEYIKITEIIRNIPPSYTIKYPNLVSHKILYMWTNFFKEELSNSSNVSGNLI